MGPWVYAVAGAAVVAALAAASLVRASRRTRANRDRLLRAELESARAEVQALAARVAELDARVETERKATERRARGDLEPVTITGLVYPPERAQRDAELVRAVEAGRPQWVPAAPVREAMIRTVALAHGVRRALSADNRDRIRWEMRAGMRRSRRQRKAEIRAVRRYLRDRRNSAA